MQVKSAGPINFSIKCSYCILSFGQTVIELKEAIEKKIGLPLYILL